MLWCACYLSPMNLVKDFLEQLGKLQAVWQPFLLASSIIGIVVWRAVKHNYQGRLDNNTELLRLRDAQLEDYKDKLSGASPDEAKARIDALETRLNILEPRNLTSAQKEKITAAMKPFEGGWIHIEADSSVGDAIRLQAGLLQAFSKANWNIAHSSISGFDADTVYPTGLVLGLPDRDAPTPAERALMRCLTEMGLHYDLVSDLRGGIRMTITHRQVG